MTPFVKELQRKRTAVGSSGTNTRGCQLEMRNYSSVALKTPQTLHM